MPSQKGLEWTFDTAVKNYDEMRPGYVAELYHDIFKAKNIDKNSNVIEVGIGTGQATLPVLKTGCNFTAIECGENLAEFCRDKFKNYSNFSVVNKKFENTDIKENSCDLIFSATAFHWIPEKIGYKKVYDSLKSGGVFARFRNHPYKDKGREELDRAIQKIYSVYMPGSSAPHEFNEKDAAKIADIAKKYGFCDTSFKLYKRTRSFTAKEYTKLLGTYSDHIAIEENTRNKFFSEIEKTIDDFGGEITLYDTIDLEIARKP